MRPWLGVGLPALLTVTPLLLAGVEAPRTFARLHPTGDPAAIEIYTREAAAGRQLVGPYSRYGFHHPGPAFFYAAVPLYLASGERHAGIQATAAVLAVAGVLAMIACAFRGGGRELAWAAALALSLAIHARGAASFASAWNPNVAALAFGAFLFALARVVAGAVRSLPLAVAAGSLAVQSHLGCAAVVLCLGALAAALAWPPLRRMGLPAPERGRFTLAFSSGLLAALWGPTLLEALGPGGGNLGTLGAVLAQASPGHSLREAAAAVGGQFPAPGANDAGLPVAACLILTASWAAVAAYRRSAHTTLALSLLCAVGAALAVVSATRVDGALYPYLLRWASMLGVGVVAAALHVAILAVGERWRPEPRARRGLATAGMATLAALALASSWRVVPEAGEGDEQRELQSQRVERLADAMQAVLRERGVRRPLVVAGSLAARPLALGLLLELDKRGASFAAQPFGVFRFPPAWRPGREDATVVLDRKPRPGEPRGEVVVRDGPYRLELLRESRLLRPEDVASE